MKTKDESNVKYFNEKTEITMYLKWVIQWTADSGGK